MNQFEIVLKFADGFADESEYRIVLPFDDGSQLISMELTVDGEPVVMQSIALHGKRYHTICIRDMTSDRVDVVDW